MKLIKLKEDHYVVVDETEIKQGDWMYNPEREPSLLQCIGKGSIRGWKKITHSTQPLIIDFVTYRGTLRETKKSNLSLQEVKELIGEVDVEKKAKKFIGCEYDDIEDSIDQIGYDSFIRGYNQALEDNKDKKYTEAQLIWAIQEAYGHGQNDEFDGVNKAEKSIIVITNYLHPKTEWEVDIINGKLTLKQ